MLRPLMRGVRQVVSPLRMAIAKAALTARCGNRLVLGAGVGVGRGVRIQIEGDGLVELGDGVQLTDSRIFAGPGSRVKIGAGSTIAGLVLHVSDSGQFVAGSNFRVNSLVAGGATNVTIRRGVATLGEFVYIDGGSYRVLDAGRLEIGGHASFGVDSEVRAELSVRIGQYTMVSYRVSIFDTNTHSLDFQQRRAEVDRYPAYERGDVHRAPVEIGDDCWIGLGSAVLKGAVIGPRSVIGLNTIVTAGVYPADSILVSGEARVVTKAHSR